MAERPYVEAAWIYWRAGWRGVLPLPPRAKAPVPRGRTGWVGLDPSGADVQAWCEGAEGAGNIGLRLPPGVHGLDVDAYGGKDGAAALGEMVERLGPLPPTWIATSRDDSVSGIRLYQAQLPPGRRWRDEPAGHGRGIEAIHFGHRYAVAWPSVHPEGRKYSWWRPDGALAGDGEVPDVRELPWLPYEWVEALSEPGEVRMGEAAGHAETLDAVHAWRTGEACSRVREVRARAVRELREALDGAALHPSARDRTHELACLGHEGHAGVREALAEHYSAFVHVRVERGATAPPAEAEWWRLMRGAVGKLVGAPAESCDCEARSGAGVQFDPFVAELENSLEIVDENSSSDVSTTAPAAPLTLADALMARLMSPAQLRALPPPLALIAGLLLLDTAAWLIAAPGSYKSFLALDWAAHVAAGQTWMGREVTRGPVLYVVAEGVAGMGPRIRAWEQRHGEMSEDVHFLPMPVQAARADHWDALVESCQRLRPVLVILDTQARVTVGLDENDNTAMGAYVEAVERLRRACGGCVLTVHHLGRSGSHARGASAIDGAQDTELRLTKMTDRRCELVIDKSKNTDDSARVELELFTCALDGGGTSLVVGAPLSSAPPQPDWRANLTLNQAVLIETVMDIFPSIGGTKAEIKAEVLKRPRRTVDGSALEPMADSAYRRAWDALVSSGRLARVEGSQRYVIGESSNSNGEVPE